MDALIPVLTPIALIDSTSLVPMTLVPLAILFSQKRPLAGATAFLAGIFVVYFFCGMVVIFGLDSAIAALNEFVTDKWKNPDTPDFVLQIVIGLVLVTIGYRMASARQEKRDKKPSESATPGEAFVFAAGLTIVGLPGALPYFAAIDQILKADLPTFPMMLSLLYYNAVLILPLVALVIIRQLFPRHADHVFGFLSRIADKWGRRIIIALLLILGLALVVDGVGWFFGRPLFPVE